MLKMPSSIAAASARACSSASLAARAARRRSRRATRPRAVRGSPTSASARPARAAGTPRCRASRRSSSTLFTTTMTGVRRVLEQPRDLRVLVGDPGRDVDDEEHEIGHPHGLGRLRAHLGREHRLLTGEAGFALGEPAAGVDDAKARPDPFRRQLAAIAGDARALLDDRGAAADDAVHERRLADVRATDDRDDRQLAVHDADRCSACTSAPPSVGTISTGAATARRWSRRGTGRATARRRATGSGRARADPRARPRRLRPSADRSPRCCRRRTRS